MECQPEPPGALEDMSQQVGTQATQTQATQVFTVVSQPVVTGPDAVLMAIAGAEPKEFQFHPETKEVFIGRHPSCGVQASDKHVSSLHFRIYRDDQQRFFVEELSSSGCFINNQLVKKNEHRALRHGDAIKIAPNATTESPFASFILQDRVQVMTKHSENGASIVAKGMTMATGSSSDRPKGEGNVEGMLNGKTEDWVARNWDIRHELGSGNFSAVRLGVDVKDKGRQYAMKMVDKKNFLQFQQKRESVLELHDEANTMMSLKHPNIVRCYLWFQTEAHLYMALELVQGGDLLHCLLDDGAFPENQAARLFNQICDAVRYLHTEKQLVHRDLKPENILLTTKDRDTMVPKLADFGLARTNMKSRDCRTFCGTPNYFAPEVITSFSSDSKSAGYGKQVDMWSLGVILYILLSGIPPFEEEQLYRQIVEGKYEFDVEEWNCITLEAKGFVKQMMTVDPVERINIHQALDHPWFKIARLCTPARSNVEPGRSFEEEPAAKRRKSDASMV